jgi:predicted aspartyl protease
VRSCFAIVVSLAAGAAVASPAPEPPADAVVGVLPFEESSEPNRVMVDLAPEGGRPFVMLLDTGASDSVLTPRMARQLGVRVRALKQDRYRRATRLGRDVQFWIDTRVSDTASRTGWEYGLLGAEFLNDFVLEIDFPGRAVRFLDPKKYEVPEQVAAEDERVVPVKMTSSRLLVPVHVNGRETRVLLDTGDPGPGVLSGKAAREVGIDVASLPEFGSAGTVLGSMQTRLLDAKSLQLAGFELGAVPLLVAPKGWYNQVGPNDSTIGYDVLVSFVIRIDYPRKRLWLKRKSDAPVGLYGSDYTLARQTGAFMSPVPGGWAVWAVLPGSAAEKLGMRAGDVVVSASSGSAPPPDEVLRSILEGKEVQVSRRQGELWVDTVLPEAQRTD